MDSNVAYSTENKRPHNFVYPAMRYYIFKFHSCPILLAYQIYTHCLLGMMDNKFNKLKPRTLI